MAVFADPFGSFTDGYHQGYEDYLKAQKAGKGSASSAAGTTPPGQIPAMAPGDTSMLATTTDSSKLARAAEAGKGHPDEATRRPLPAMTGDAAAAPVPANVPLPPPRPLGLGGAAPTPFDATPLQAAPPAPATLGGRVQGLESFLNDVARANPPVPDSVGSFEVSPRNRVFMIPRDSYQPVDPFGRPEGEPRVILGRNPAYVAPFDFEQAVANRRSLRMEETAPYMRGLDPAQRRITDRYRMDEYGANPFYRPQIYDTYMGRAQGVMIP